MSQQIVLFDLPCKDPCRSWSFNTLRARLALNYKGLDYRTEWLEYPEIKPRLEPHLPGRKEYTLPTILLPTGEYIMDSALIASTLETMYPAPDYPSLNLDSSPSPEDMYKLIGGFAVPLLPHFMPLVPKRILRDASHEYWYRTREPMFGGIALDEVFATKGGPKAWEDEGSKGALREVTGLLEKRGDGGDGDGKASYAELVWVGMLLFIQRMGDDQWELFKEAGGGEDGVKAHERLLEDTKKWWERDGH